MCKWETSSSPGKADIRKCLILHTAHLFNAFFNKLLWVWVLRYYKVCIHSSFAWTADTSKHVWSTFSSVCSCSHEEEMLRSLKTFKRERVIYKTDTKYIFISNLSCKCQYYSLSTFIVWLLFMPPLKRRMAFTLFVPIHYPFSEIFFLS